MKQYLKRISILGFSRAGVIFLGSFLGLLLLLLAHLLPIRPIMNHLGQSRDLIEREFANETAVMGYQASLSGSFTDCLMLQYAVYDNPEHTVIEQTLKMYRSEKTGENEWAPGYSLLDYMDGTVTNEVQYPRYWHGYLTVLKPLLCITNLNTIQLLAGNLQLLLLGFCLVCLCKRNQPMLAIGLVISMPFLYFFSLYSSLSLSICYYLMIFGILGILFLINRKTNHEKVGLFFLVIGMSTAYFDLLTYPLVTLCFPLCVYLALTGDKWVEVIKQMIRCSVEWAFGYLGMWFMKFAWTYILLGENIFLDALHTVKVRTGLEQGNILKLYFQVIVKNIDPYLNIGFFLWLAPVVVGFILIMLSKSALMRNNWRNAIIVGMVGLYPFAWYFVTSNHSYEHWMFTCKELSIVVFAMSCGVAILLRKHEEIECTYEKR